MAEEIFSSLSPPRFAAATARTAKKGMSLQQNGTRANGWSRQAHA